MAGRSAISFVTGDGLVALQGPKVAIVDVRCISCCSSLLFLLSSLVSFLFILFGSTNKKLYVILRVRVQNQASEELWEWRNTSAEVLWHLGVQEDLSEPQSIKGLAALGNQQVSMAFVMHVWSNDIMFYVMSFLLLLPVAKMSYNLKVCWNLAI